MSHVGLFWKEYENCKWGYYLSKKLILKLEQFIGFLIQMYFIFFYLLGLNKISIIYLICLSSSHTFILKKT